MPSILSTGVNAQRPGSLVGPYEGIPMILNSSVTLPTPGSTGIPDMAALQSPYRQPYLIDEIYFILKGSTASASVNAIRQGVVRVRMSVGQYALSTAAIPISNFGPIIQQQNLSNSDSGQAGLDFQCTYYRWVLPRPLLVGEGMSIQPIFTRDLIGAAASLVAGVTYVCRRLPNFKMPKEFDVPYVGFYETPEATSTTVAIAPRSSATDLFNPFQAPLYVQRFLARTRQRAVNGIGTGGEQIRIYPGIQSSVARATGSGTLQGMRLEDSRGYDITKDYAFETVDINRAAWTYSRSLASKEWYTAAFPAFTAIVAAGQDPIRAVAYQVSFVGFRSEKT